MKKKYLLSLLILFSFLFMIDVKALTSEVTYQTTYKNGSLNLSRIDFSKLTFVNNSYSYNGTINNYIGVVGEIRNNYTNDVNYTSTVSFYNYYKQYLGQCSFNQNAAVGNKVFIQLCDVSVIKDNKVSDIAYYNLNVNISDTALFNTPYLPPSKLDSYAYKTFVIDHYDVYIKVNENNTLEITETINAYFNQASHGILREIPIVNKISRLDSTTSSLYTQLYDLSVSEKYTFSKSNGYYTIKIGNSNKTISDEHKYVIKYTYNLGKDPLKDKDELYFNIIGTDWDTAIGKVTFKIEMPKEFDSNKLGFSAGSLGSTYNALVNYKVNGTTITGSYKDILRPNEGLTIRCELPEGYFVNAKLNVNVRDYIWVLIPIVLLIIGLVCWFKYGKNDKVVKTVEFYPPKGLNSLDVALIYKGKVKAKDVTALLIYLANKGYVKISDNPDKKKKNDFVITKLKDYDGHVKEERLLLEGLFKKNKNNVTSKGLYNSFYSTTNKILNSINNEESVNKVFESKPKYLKFLHYGLAILSYIIITAFVLYNYGNIAMLIVAVLFPLIALIVFNSVVLNEDSDLPSKIFCTIWSAFFGIPVFCITVIPCLIYDRYNLICYMVGIICSLVIYKMYKYYLKRTSYGNELYSKIVSFREFLITVEKEQLEKMVNEHPTYFYDILPYTYVLGISNKWIKKFDSIHLQAPEWYSSDNFNYHTFNVFMSSTVHSVNRSAARTKSSSSGSSSGGYSSSSSSGGGSSGGGSGGGGGSSW